MESVTTTMQQVQTISWAVSSHWHMQQRDWFLSSRLSMTKMQKPQSYPWRNESQVSKTYIVISWHHYQLVVYIIDIVHPRTTTDSVLHIFLQNILNCNSPSLSIAVWYPMKNAKQTIMIIRIVISWRYLQDSTCSMTISPRSSTGTRWQLSIMSRR